jgi:hypothetical protein
VGSDYSLPDMQQLPRYWQANAKIGVIPDSIGAST